jgi:proteic killer suppression protein
MSFMGWRDGVCSSVLVISGREAQTMTGATSPSSARSSVRPARAAVSAIPKGAGWAKIARVATSKLDMLDYAAALSDLVSPPGNRLEALRGDLAGFHSIRINDQWRIVFRWGPAGPLDVDIRDYH